MPIEAETRRKEVSVRLPRWPTSKLERGDGLQRRPPWRGNRRAERRWAGVRRGEEGLSRDAKRCFRLSSSDGGDQMMEIKRYFVAGRSLRTAIAIIISAG